MELSQVDLETEYAYPDHPWVRTDFVSSLDGAAWSEAGTSGDFGGHVDKAAFSMMRSLADVVVVGAGTARDEGYRPLTASSTDAEVRSRHGLDPVLALVVVTRSLDVPDELVDGGAVVLTCGDAPADRLRDLRSRTDVLVSGRHEIDWSDARAQLVDRGWSRILCEGGPGLHGAMLAAGVVDEICVTIAPVVASGDAGRIATHDESLGRSARLASALDVEGVLLTRWILS